MPDSRDVAVRLTGVSKSYSLEKPGAKGLGRLFGIGRRSQSEAASASDFLALDDISLEIERGQRLAIVGRNGAGKTTLLKLLCENFAPTRGVVEVNGEVQALLGLGVGFHPEMSGRKNVENALNYNNLSASEIEAAVADIDDFCELDEFFDQPVKAYSSGMLARLMFAVATAVRPDILIVDEVLGAGDAYFIAKSKLRVEQLVKSGCTLILVSHSTQQVLELCERAIWLDKGRVKLEDDAFLVVKAYEEFLHGPIKQLRAGTVDDAAKEGDGPIDEPDRVGAVRAQALTGLLQEPEFQPHAQPAELDIGDIDPNEFYSLAPGGISRWESDVGLKVCGFAAFGEAGPNEPLISMRPACFQFTLRAENSARFDCRYGIALHTYSGDCLTRVFSPRDQFDISEGDTRIVRLMLNPNQIGPGEFVVGISVLRYAAIELLNSTPRYDLLSRSFVVKIELPDSLGALESAILHSGEWEFDS